MGNEIEIGLVGPTKGQVEIENHHQTVKYGRQKEYPVDPRKICAEVERVPEEPHKKEKQQRQRSECELAVHKPSGELHDPPEGQCRRRSEGNLK